jgi:hypothetical protein
MMTDVHNKPSSTAASAARRFYRKKYNAQQVLAQFAQTARDETDLDELLAELVRVVDETLQPEHVSVWLKKQ